MDFNKRKPELLIVAAAAIILAAVVLYSVFDKPKYNDLQAAEIKITETVKQETTQSSEKININTADVSALSQLELIGEKKAQAIIDYREKNGKFRSAEEITNVSGIGTAVLESNRDRIIF